MSLSFASPKDAPISSNKSLKVIHVGQRHKLPFGYKPSTELFNSIVKSQLNVAKIIKSHPHYPIVMEGLDEDEFASEQSAFSPIAKMLFPKGIPSELDDLNESQKEFIYENTACFTLFYLGEIPAIYKAIHKEACLKIDKQMSEASKGLMSEAREKKLMFEARELEAIECIKEAAKQHFKKRDDGLTVILVFGRAHNFKPFCDKEGFELEVIETYHQPSLFRALVKSVTSLCPRRDVSAHSSQLKDSERKDDRALKYLNDELNKCPKNIKNSPPPYQVYLTICFFKHQFFKFIQLAESQPYCKKNKFRYNISVV